MKPDEYSNGEAESSQTVLGIIRDLQSGALGAKSLGADDRRRCVEHLTLEGYSIAEMSEILKVTERTIARDRAAIRKANAVERDPEMTGLMVGQLLTQADTCLQRIRRITRERDTPPNVRIDGERACWMIFHNLVQLLQSLGYLPTAPQQFRAEMKHQIEQLRSFGEMKDELTRVELIVNARGIGEENLPLLQELTDLKDLVARGSLNEQIAAIENRVVNTGETGDEQNT